MNKQQLAALADQLIEGMVIVGEHSPTLPPGPEEVAYDYVLSFGEGLFTWGSPSWRDTIATQPPGNSPRMKDGQRKEKWIRTVPSLLI